MIKKEPTKRRELLVMQGWEMKLLKAYLTWSITTNHSEHRENI
jgi:hypothetical protein